MWIRGVVGLTLATVSQNANSGFGKGGIFWLIISSLVGWWPFCGLSSFVEIKM